MKPEELKIIAEGMGYKFPSRSIPEVIVVKGKDGHGVWEYNPLTNDTQCMEIMERLLNSGYVFAKHSAVNVFIVSHTDDIETAICSGKTINEAVCKAAFKYFK